MGVETLVLALTGAFSTLLAFLVRLCVSQRREIRRLNAALLLQARGDLSTAAIEHLSDETVPNVNP